METDLKDAYFDVVVVGTGLPESALAVLLASNGKSVLHLDSRPFYGADWATLSLKKWKRYFVPCYVSQNGVNKAEWTTAQLQQLVQQKEQFQSFPNVSILPVEENASFTETQVVDQSSSVKDEWLNQTLLDLTPQIILGSGKAVDMLVRTQAASYLEFRGVDEIFCVDESAQPQKVPSSRNDIFRSTLLTPVEKRLFMKCLKTCACYESSLVHYEGHDGGLLSAGQVISTSEDTIIDREQVHKWCQTDIGLENWLDELHFTNRLKQYFYTLLSCCGEKDLESCSVATAVERISQYCCAIQRFRISSGFICSKYGTGDICEALCRRCAIHNGVYILRRKVSHLIVDSSSQVIGLVTGHGDIIRCSVLVASPNWEVNKTDSTWTRQLETEAFTGRWKLYMILDRPLLLPGKGVCILNSHTWFGGIVNEQKDSKYFPTGLQVEQQVDSLHTVYVIYLFCDDRDNGKMVLMNTLERLLHPFRSDSDVKHSSSDLLQLVKQVNGLKYACVGFCRDWEPKIQLESYYSCSITKDMHSMQTQIDRIYSLYDTINRRYQ